MSSYFLSKHAFVCVSGSRVVLLDLESDRYLDLDAGRARSLEGVVAGWPVFRGDDINPPPPEVGKKVAASMLRRGLLTTDHSRGKTASPLTVVAPRDSALGSFDDEEGEARIGWRHAGVFFWAVIAAALRLRCRSIEWIVADVCKRKAASIESLHGGGGPTLKELVHIFDRLRSFTYSARDACMFDSLALLYFLLRLGFQPRWVIGVRSSPTFTAHCWLQDGGTVLNDIVDHVAVYTPIMAA